MMEQSVPLAMQLERVWRTMDAFSEKRLKAEMVYKCTDVLSPCYTSSVKALDVPYENYHTEITDPLVPFRLSRPIARVFETTKKATDFETVNTLHWNAVHCLILDHKRHSTEDRQSWQSSS